ncbi:hypothetical protein LBMAG42_24260 [Deltaproteobacteria bacterium]|nr:hypothetical protein LBMAG42_24260 [Deltaproteobacteria bacterium]
MTHERAGRLVVGLGLAMAWASLGRVLRVEGLPYAPFGLDALPMNAGIGGVASVVFVAAWLAFVRDWRADRAAGALVTLLALGAQAQRWQAPADTGVNGATMLPGAALFAWWVARRTARDPLAREERGIEAACGLVAACYTVAVASKLYMSGLGWASPGNIGLQIATQAYLAPEPIQSLRLAAASSGLLCGALGVGTILIEGGAILFIFPAIRAPIAALLVAMHVGIAVLMGLHHYDWMFTAVGWALVSAASRRDRPGAG